MPNPETRMTHVLTLIAARESGPLTPGLVSAVRDAAAA